MQEGREVSIPPRGELLGDNTSPEDKRFGLVLERGHPPIVFLPRDVGIILAIGFDG